MKTKIFFLGLLMSLSSLLFAQPADNFQDRPGKEEHDCNMQITGRERGPHNFLDLSEEQRESFKQLRIAMHKEIQPVKNELDEALAHQKTLVTAEKPDMKAINQNLDKIGDLKTKISKIQTKNKLEMRALLNDEQKLKFDMMKDFKKDHFMAEGKKEFRPMN